MVFYQYQTINRAKDSLLERLHRKGIDHADNYINFYGLRSHDRIRGKLVTEMVYIHCKMMVVDDQVWSPILES